MPRYRCYSHGVEPEREALDYEAPSAAKAAASHTAYLYKNKVDLLAEHMIWVFDVEKFTRWQFKVKVIHTIEFKAIQQ